jgi:hypothetical protein
MKRRNEKEVYWMNRPAKTLRRVETLCRQAAEAIDWDGDIVWGLIRDRIDNGDVHLVIAAYNDTSMHFGCHVTWDGDLISVYMYSE